MSCSHTTSCQLYPMLAMEPALLLWKKHYCEGDFEKCQRYKLSLEGKPIPLTLLPNGKKLEKRSSSEINSAALFNAIEKKRVPIVRSILKHSSKDVELRTSDGLTPLMAAASIGSSEIVEVILSHGCNPWKKNISGKSALDYALIGGNQNCEDLIRAQMATTPESEFKQESVTKEQEESEESFVTRFLRKINPFSSKGVE